MKRTIQIFEFSTMPELATEGWNPNACDGADYNTPRADALYAALGVSKSDDEYSLARHTDGRWALFGLTVSGHRYAAEVDTKDAGTVYEIRKGSMLGPLLATVRVCEDHGRCTEPDMGGRGAIEVAALRGASASQVRRHFGGPNRRNGYGINRETGTPGVSGIFSLWKEDGSHGRSNVGSIHVSKA